MRPRTRRKLSFYAIIPTAKKRIFTLLRYKNPQKIIREEIINSVGNRYSARSNLMERKFRSKINSFVFRFDKQHVRFVWMTGKGGEGKGRGRRRHRVNFLGQVAKDWSKSSTLRWQWMGKGLFLAGGVFRYVLQRRSGVRGPLYPIIIASQQRFSFPSSTAGRLPFISFYPPERASVSEVFPPPATVLEPGT